MIDTTGVIISTAKITGDVISLGVVFGTLMKVLPPLAALISILWIGFQFYNSEPIKDWRKRRKEKKNGPT